jgi:hypothetical protein
MALFIEKTWLFWWVLALGAIIRSYSPPSANPNGHEQHRYTRRSGPFEKLSHCECSLVPISK